MIFSNRFARSAASAPAFASVGSNLFKSIILYQVRGITGLRITFFNVDRIN